MADDDALCCDCWMLDAGGDAMKNQELSSQ